MNIEEFFLKLRFDPAHHLGLGDVRLTLGQQDELIAAFKRSSDVARDAARYHFIRVVGYHGIGAGSGTNDEKAREAYALADAMIAARLPQERE